MGKRIVTGVLWAVYLVAVIIFGGWPYWITVGGLMLIGTHEIQSVFKSADYRIVEWPGFVISALLVPAMLWKGAMGMLIVFCLGFVVALAWQVFHMEDTMGDLTGTAFGLFYPAMPLGFLALLMRFEPEPMGKVMVILVLACTFIGDTFAYFAGRAFGRHKLCPKVSPKKTVEGFIGGFAGSILAGIVTALVVEHLFHVPVSMLYFVLTGILCGVAGPLGDLSASVIKRKLGVKDFGNFLPGHGGIIDRFDGVLFTAPMTWMLWTLFLGA